MKTPFYLFMHIPKTAGTTLGSILDLQFERQNVITYYNQNSTQLLENLDATLEVGRHEYKALIGHYPIGIHRTLQRPAKYITFLRDPVARAVSSYYENEKVGSPAVRRDDGSFMTLEECLHERGEFFANQQLKMLVGKGAMEPLDEEDLAVALSNLSRFFLFVGLSEYFDASILLLSKLVGWSPCSYGQLNIGSGAVQLDEQVSSTLAQLNELETRLYNSVTKNFFSKMRRAGRKFDRALGELTKTTSAARRVGLRQAEFLDRDHTAIKSYLSY